MSINQYSKHNPHTIPPLQKYYFLFICAIFFYPLTHIDTKRARKFHGPQTFFQECF